MEANELRLQAVDLNQQAVLLIKAGNYESAKDKLERAINADPMLEETYKNYGDLYMAVENYEEAKNMYKKAMLIKKEGIYFFLYGNACFMNDEVHEGLEYYNLAVSNGYDNDEMMYFLGMAYQHLNDDTMALRFFQKASIKNPSRPDYIVQKITTEIRLGLGDSALKDADELIRISPEIYDGYHLKTQLLVQQKDLPAAIENAKFAADKFPNDTDLTYDYIKTVALSHDFDKALRLLDNATQMKYYEDSQAKFLCLRTEILAEAQRMDEAIECAEECFKLEDENTYFSELRFIAMNIYFAQLNFEKTLEMANHIIAADRKDLFYFGAIYYRCFCLKKLGRDEEATKAYKEANSMYRLHTMEHPSAIDVYLYRAMVLKDMEEYDKSLELLDFILGLGAEIAEVYLCKAEIFEATGRASQAATCKDKAYEIKPELKPVEK